MYRSAVFDLADDDALDLINRVAFAQLVIAGVAGFEATPLPMLLAPDHSSLVAHVARANPLWRLVAAAPSGECAAIALLLGADAYVSPSLYPSKQEHGRVVPTWNYSAVYVHGTLGVREEPDFKRMVVMRLTDYHESTRDEPWRLTDAPDEYVEAMLGGIVGLELRIERIEAKAKLSQNRPDRDRTAVEQAFAAGSPSEQAVAAAMNARTPPDLAP